MTLFQRLISYFHSPIWKGPDAVLGMRVTSGSVFSWSVADHVLTINTGTTTIIDLTAITLSELRSDLIGLGLTVTVPDDGSLSARTVIDQSGSGDSWRLQVFTSLAWALEDAYSVELEALSASVDGAIQDAYLDTSSGEWVDYWFGFFNNARQSGESDADYLARAIAELAYPHNNGVAIAAAVQQATGIKTRIVNYESFTEDFPVRDGTVYRDGTFYRRQIGISGYGLFDCEVYFETAAISQAQYDAYVAVADVLIERMRAGGFYLRQYTLMDAVIV